MRQAAFPFDWIDSFDGEALIEMLKEDFLDFLNEDFLAWDFGGALLHTRYHLEFLHEGDWRGDQYVPNMQRLKPKYQRRVERFRELANYPGKVFFIRAAYIYSVTDPHRYYKFQDNIEISDTYALRLYGALKFRFPKLNMNLIILNSHDRQTIEEEGRLSDHILMIRSKPLQDFSPLVPSFQEFFAKLCKEEALVNRP